MNQTEKYHELKKRNQQQLLAIRKLESHIEKTRQQVEQRRKTTIELKNQYEQLKHSTLQQTKYQKLIFDKQQTQTQFKAPLPITGRRDLTKLLALTPEKICSKIEEMLETQLTKQQIIPSTELTQIKKLMDRLSDPNNKEQYNNIIRQLLVEHEKLKNTLIINKYDMNNNKKIESILEYLEYRKRKVKELSTRNNQLILECQEAEKSLQQRVESLHDDPSIQYALTKNIRIKAASHQAQTELHCMKNHIEDLTNQIDNIEDQTKEDIINQNSVILNNLTLQHEKVLQLLNTNNSCHNQIKNRSIDLKEESLKDSTMFFKRIDTAKANLVNRNIIATINQSSRQPQSKELLDAKNQLSPLSLISTIQFIKEILNTMQSVSVLEKESVVELCSEIRETLEKLVEKWGSSLSKQDVHIPSSVPVYHDGIDNVIQSIDAIRLHFQEKEHAFIKEQEQKLKSKLATADNIEKGVHDTIDAIEERELITAIGDSFTVSDKSFQEWSEMLLK